MTVPLHTLIDDVTNGIAGGAVTSPLWLPYLKTISDFAAVLTPILGGLWLIGRIIYSIYRCFSKKGKIKDTNDS
ncbi:MAG: hypothetical protein [Caudoviricetes sp.]|nr:MAG: hypothetical protein [Caudoviricetes sp.]